MLRSFKILICAASMFVLILFPDVGIHAISDSIELCLKTVIPCLFPFFFLTSILNNSLNGLNIPLLKGMTKYLRIPAGGESILLLGLTGGYPVGAKLVGDLYHDGKLDRVSAERLLCYCSNSGPAFIFGLIGTAFPSVIYPLLLWVIHILSAIATGWILPKPSQRNLCIKSATSVSVSDTLYGSLKTTSVVCGWIVLCKVFISYIMEVCGSQLPDCVNVYLIGILELSNGCVKLCEIPSISTRFLICNALLAFGGICVILQTAAVTKGLDIRFYLIGKTIQMCISTVIAAIVLITVQENIPFVYISVIVLIGILLIYIFRQQLLKISGNPEANVI